LANQALQNMLRDICFVGARNFFKIADKSKKDCLQPNVTWSHFFVPFPSVFDALLHNEFSNCPHSGCAPVCF
jgi:hypothetical protein